MRVREIYTADDVAKLRDHSYRASGSFQNLDYWWIYNFKRQDSADLLPSYYLLSTVFYRFLPIFTDFYRFFTS